MNFDLNIENYTRDELIQMFELPSNFDRNIIDIKESKLREGIINNTEINKDTQIKTLNFLLICFLSFQEYCCYNLAVNQTRKLILVLCSYQCSNQNSYII